MKPKVILLYLIVPLFFTVLFVRNLILSDKDQLDPWLGGGMRMFSSVDSMNERLPIVGIEVNDSIYTVNLWNFPDLANYHREVRILPSDRRMKKLVDRLQEKNWCLDEHKNLELCNDKSPNSYPVKIKWVSIYRVNYDVNFHKVTFGLLKKYEANP